MTRSLVAGMVLVPTAGLCQSHPMFITSAQETVYAQMKTDYEANTASPATYGGRFYKYIKASADAETDFMGMARAWMYHVTGTSSYAVSAYAAQAGWLAKAETTAALCGNVSSHEWPQRVLIYDWIYSGLSAGERTTFLNKLNVTANLCAVSQPDKITDIDLVIGDYVGVAMLHTATTSYNSTINTYWADGTRNIGGYVAEAANYDDRRNAVRYFTEVLAAGGDGGDGSQYNTHTTSLLLLGYWALEITQGTSNFGEIATWLGAANLPEAYTHMLSPDFTVPHQWGDEEQTDPRGPEAFYRLDTAQCIAGLAQSNTAFQDWFLDWVDDRGGFASVVNGSKSAASGANPWFKCAPVWNPYATRGDKTSLATAHHSSGMGVSSVRSGWGSSASWFVSTMTPRDSGLAHSGFMFGDFQFWRNGRWVLTHPIAYAGPSVDGRYSGTIAFPVGPQVPAWEPEYRGALAFHDDGDYAYVAGTQGGSVFWDDYYGMPDTVLHEDSRSLVWLKSAGIIVAFSRTNIDDPRPCDSRYGGLEAVCAAAPLRRLTIHAPVTPTQTSNRVDWTNAGDTVRVTNLLPASVSYAVVNETAEWPTLAWRGYFNAGEARSHVSITPSVEQKWQTFLHVYDTLASSPRTATLVQDTSNKVDAVFVADTGQNYLLAFNAIQGADVPQPYFNAAWRGYLFVEPHQSQVAAVLDTVRQRGTGYSLTFTVSANSTKLLLFDLDPGEAWEYTINGGGAISLTVNSDGIAEVDIANTGSVTLAVLPSGSLPVLINNGSLPAGTLGDSCAGDFDISGGDGGPYACSVSVGSAPTGCTLNSNCTWSGTYDAAGDHTFTVQACDGTPLCGSRQFTVSVSDLPIITTATFAAGVVGVAYSESCSGSGGATPYVFTVDPDPPCPGLTLNSGTCAITGTPTTVGTCNFTITLTDDDSLTADRSFALSIGDSLGAIVAWADVQGYRALINYRLSGLPLSSSCDVSVYDNAGLIATSTQSTGLARRQALVTNLDASTIYHATVDCGVAVTASPVYFTTLSAPSAGERTVPFQLTRPSVLSSAARVTVDWDYDGDMSPIEDSVQDTSCSTNCSVDVIFPQQNVYYYRWRWQDGSDNVLATSAIQPLVVP